MSELKKLKSMSPMSAEATVVRNYLDWMIDLPWYKKDKINSDLNKAAETTSKNNCLVINGFLCKWESP